MKNQIFQNKVAVITGSSSGIGKVTAIMLAERGASIVINGRNQTKLDLVKKEIEQQGYAVLAIAADITNYKDCVRLIEETVRHFGKIDILINNASVTTDDTFDNLEPAVFIEVFQSNSLGAMLPTKAAIPYLKESKGSVLFISSLAGLHGLTSGSPYSAGKMALTAFWQSLSIELKHTGIHFGICYLSFTQNDESKRMLSHTGEKIPLKSRPKYIVQSQEKVASILLDCIRKRKSKMVLSTLGKTTNFIFRFFPRLSLLTLKALQRTNRLK